MGVAIKAQHSLSLQSLKLIQTFQYAGKGGKMASVPFMAFQNETDSFRIGELMVENRLDRISIDGSLDLTRDQAGLAAALKLKRLIDAAIEEMKRDRKLPEIIESMEIDRGEILSVG